MNLVSIILPAYNASLTIRDTIKSILNQSFKDFELIIINDGSTDGTVEVLRKFTDDRIRLFNFKNRGLPESRNRGIKKAKGKYISFIDADDMWVQQKLEFQYNALLSNPDCDVAYSWTLFIDESGTILHPLRTTKYNGYVFEHLICSNFIGSGSNILATRGAIKKTGYFNTEYKSSEDWDYYLRLSKSFKFVYVPKFQILYRQSPNSMTNNIGLIESEAIRVTNDTFNNIKDLDIKKKPISISNIKLYSAYLYLTRQPKGIWKRKVFLKCCQSLRLYPQNLFNISFLYIILALLIVSILPSKYSSGVLKFLLKLYGKCIRLITALK